MKQELNDEDTGYPSERWGLGHTQLGKTKWKSRMTGEDLLISSGIWIEKCSKTQIDSFSFLPYCRNQSNDGLKLCDSTGAQGRRKMPSVL